MPESPVGEVLPGRGGLLVTPASVGVLDGKVGLLFLAGNTGFEVGGAVDREGRAGGGGGCVFCEGRCGGGGGFRCDSSVIESSLVVVDGLIGGGGALRTSTFTSKLSSSSLEESFSDFTSDTQMLSWLAWF